METVHQSITKDGLQIPLALFSRYGMKQGAKVTLSFEPDGIRIVPAELDQEAIENLALRYLLRTVGDAVFIEVKSHQNSWQVEVFGSDHTTKLGMLFYDPAGNLRQENSSTPKQMRQAALDAAR
ncbi:MAG TPA: hypothetical protein VI451_11410 [Anaerolineales bacterium]|nr:hypothetical protein [Anaerolineales bacterium]